MIEKKKGCDTYITITIHGYTKVKGHGRKANSELMLLYVDICKKSWWHGTFN